METALREEFAEVQLEVEDDHLITKCAQLCRRFGLNAADFVAKWSAYALNHKLDAVPKATTVDHFVTDTLEKASKIAAKAEEQDVATVDTILDAGFLGAFGVASSDAKEIQDNQMKLQQRKRQLERVTSKRAARKPKIKSVAGNTGTDYGSRKNSGQVVKTYNPSNLPTSFVKRPVDLEKLETPGVYPTGVATKYRFMFQKLLNITEVLDMRIEELGNSIVKKHKLLETVTKGEETEGEEQNGEKELGHVGLPAQEDIAVVGRICVDAAAGKLNEKSIVLEGSRDTSNGTRVELDLSDVASYSLFPGQIIGAVGTNATGTLFSPKRLYQGAPLPMPRTKPADLRKIYGDESQPTDIIFASGPYSTNDNTNYAPLMDLLDVVKRDTPDWVVLAGPFVDRENHLIKEGEVDMTFEDLYKDVVSKIISTLEDVEGTQVILIPTLRDIHHDEVYPQPPLPEVDHTRVHCFSNPCTIQINEVTIGLSATDVLKDLSRQEASRVEQSDRMGRLVNHLLEQRSYYPMYPPDMGCNFDFAHIDQTALPITPDVLVLPSELQHFNKSLNGCLAINPGRLTKHRYGGTYAKMIIHPPRMIPEDNTPIYHGITSRAVIETIRI